MGLRWFIIPKRGELIMGLLEKKIFALLFYSVISIFLVAFFISTLIQGISMQVFQKESFIAFSHYLVALLSLVAAGIVYARARKIIGIISTI